MDQEIDIDSDYEENSVDPFDSSESEIDDSDDEIDQADRIVESFDKKLRKSFGTLKMKFLTFERIFNENTFSSWKSLENQRHFSDKHFQKEKLSPNIGYRRNLIPPAMLENPFELYDFVYGNSRSGMFKNKMP